MTKKTLEELENILNEVRQKHGYNDFMLVQHRATGNKYRTVCLSLNEADLEPLVTYSDPGMRIRFTRPFAQFREKFSW